VSAGRHVILDCYDCDHHALKDQVYLETLLCQSAREAGATILHTYFHKFDRGEGVTGVVALSESHISIHTWPEYGFMAIDIFMCSDCDPSVAIAYVIKEMDIGRYNVHKMIRGEKIG
jgi:S-adenosylmethionine decarboxylase